MANTAGQERCRDHSAIRARQSAAANIRIFSLRIFVGLAVSPEQTRLILAWHSVFPRGGRFLEDSSAAVVFTQRHQAFEGRRAAAFCCPQGLGIENRLSAAAVSGMVHLLGTNGLASTFEAQGRNTALCMTSGAAGAYQGAGDAIFRWNWRA